MKRYSDGILKRGGMNLREMGLAMDGWSDREESAWRSASNQQRADYLRYARDAIRPGWTMGPMLTVHDFVRGIASAEKPYRTVLLLLKLRDGEIPAPVIVEDGAEAEAVQRPRWWVRLWRWLRPPTIPRG